MRTSLIKYGNRKDFHHQKGIDLGKKNYKTRNSSLRELQIYRLPVPTSNFNSSVYLQSQFVVK